MEIREEGPKTLITLSQFEMISGVNWRDLEVNNIITTGGDGVVDGNLSGAKCEGTASALELESQSVKLMEQLCGSTGKGGPYGEWRSDFFRSASNGEPPIHWRRGPGRGKLWPG